MCVTGKGTYGGRTLSWGFQSEGLTTMEFVLTGRGAFWDAMVPVLPLRSWRPRPRFSCEGSGERNEPDSCF